MEERGRAGFPSPEDDLAITRLDLIDLLITHLLATVYWQLSGSSMVELRINYGNLLVVKV